MLTNLLRDRECFLEENYAHSLTGNPYSEMSLYIIIEVTMNKGSKLKTGMLSILKKKSNDWFALKIVIIQLASAMLCIVILVPKNVYT